MSRQKHFRVGKQVAPVGVWEGKVGSGQGRVAAWVPRAPEPPLPLPGGRPGTPAPGPSAQLRGLPAPAPTGVAGE